MIKEQLWLVIYPAKFLVLQSLINDRDATVSVMHTETHYRISPLVKDGMGWRSRGKYLFPCAKQSSDELYREPKEETVLGSFLSRNQKEPERHVKSRETMQGKNENPISSHHLK